jgi:hypothetical protein
MAESRQPTPQQDIEFVRDQLGEQAREITKDPMALGPARAHRALDRIEAQLADLERKLDMCDQAYRSLAEPGIR